MYYTECIVHIICMFRTTKGYLYAFNLLDRAAILGEQITLLPFIFPYFSLYN